MGNDHDAVLAALNDAAGRGYSPQAYAQTRLALALGQVVGLLAELLAIARQEAGRERRGGQ